MNTFISKSEQEIRDHERFAVSLDVHLNSLTASNRAARISDISLSGCYISTILPVEIGEQIQMQISTPTGNYFTVKGTVAFRDPHLGFGVKFDLRGNEKQFLEALIDYFRQEN